MTRAPDRTGIAMLLAVNNLACIALGALLVLLAR